MENADLETLTDCRAGSTRLFGMARGCLAATRRGARGLGKVGVFFIFHFQFSIFHFLLFGFRHAENLLDGGSAAEDLHQAVIAEQAHSLIARQIADILGAGAADDQLADLVAHA